MATTDSYLVIMIAWVFIVCIADTILSIYSTYQLCKADSVKWINKTYRNLMIVVMALFTLSSIGDLLHMLLISSIFPMTNTVTTEKYIAIIVDSLYLTGDITFYILILMRIYMPFEINKCTLFYFICVIITFVFAVTVYLWTEFYFLNASGLYYQIEDIVLMCIDLILNLTILTIFVKKMRSMISNVDASLSNAAQRNVNLMSNIVVKHSVLFGMAMIINQAYFSIALYGDISDLWRLIWFRDLAFSVRALENIVNIIALLLVLKINYEQYICLCGSCHRCVGKCCFRHIDSKTISDCPYLELKEVVESESLVVN